MLLIVLLPMAVAQQDDREDPAHEELPAALSPLRVETHRQVGASSDQPVSTTLIEIDESLRARQLQEFSTLLSGQPGVVVLNQQNFAQDARIAVRGFGARASFGIRGLEIRQDGMPLSLPDGQGQVDTISAQLLDRITVVRGPAAVRYGNAAGGAILLETLDVDDPEARRFSHQQGSFDYRATLVSGAVSGDGVSHFLAGTETRLDGYRHHAGARVRQGLYKLGTGLGQDWRLDLGLQVTDAPKANDPGGLTWAQVLDDPRQARARNVDFAAGESLDQKNLQVSLSRAGTPTQWRLTGFHQQRDFENRLPFVGGGAVQIDRTFSGASVEMRLNPAAQLEWLTGLDYERQDDQRLRFDNRAGTLGDLALNQTEKADTTALFTLASWQPGRDWTLQAGARHDRLELSVSDAFLADGEDSGARRFTETTWSAGVTRQLTAAQQLFASYGTAFESPTFTELANPDGGGGFNPSLAPQQTRGFELGWRGNSDRWRSEIVLFDLDVDNELLPFELDNQPGRTFFRNSGASSRRGLESSLGFRPHDQWQATATWTWSDFEFGSNPDRPQLQGNSLPGIPEHQVHAELAWLPVAGRGVAVEGTYRSRIWADDSNRNAAPAQVVFNLRAFHTFSLGDQSLRLSAGINNLNDERIIDNVRLNAFGGRFYEPGPDHSYYLGLDWLY